MNAINPQVEKRAWYYKQEKVKSVRLAHLRNSSMRWLAIILPLLAIILITADRLGRSDLFLIDEIEYHGVFEYVDQNTIDQTVKDALQGNFFTIDLKKIRTEVLSVPWVKDVNVRRKWPNSIALHVSEYAPRMRWGEEGWVSRTGNIILDNNFSVDIQVPILNGDAQYVSELFAFAQLWQKQLAQQGLILNEIDRSSSSAWVIRFSHSLVDVASVADEVDEDTHNRRGNTTLLLGSDDVQNRLDRFLRMYSQNAVLLKAGNVVDARYPNGLAIVPAVDNNVESNASNSNGSGVKKRLSSL